MKSALLALMLLCLSSLAGAQRVSNPVLILVQPGLPNLFDPSVDPDTVIHDFWVRWPAEQLPPNGNRLLSIATGLDWQGNRNDNRFTWSGGRNWKSSAWLDLRARGYLSRRKAIWQDDEVRALTNGVGEPPRNALLLALGSNSPLVQPLGLDDPWPAGKTMVIEATRTEDGKKIMSRTRGRVLVVEYPPPRGQTWGRMWLQGPGWPDGIPTDSKLRVPGLVPAESLAALLKSPEAFTWRPRPDAWTGANRWLNMVASSRFPVFCIVGVLLLGLGFGCALTISQEKRSIFLSAGLRAVILLPAAFVVGGNVALYAGLGGIAVWTVVVWAAMAGLAATINLAISRAGWRPDMLGFGVVGLVALLLSDPRFSVYSRVLSPGALVAPPEPLGAMIGCAAIVLGCFRPWRRVSRVAVAVATFALIVAGSLLPLWWGEGTIPIALGLWAVPAACWSRERGLLFVAGIVTGAIIAALVLFHGVAYLPNGLLVFASQAGSINTFESLHVLVSPLTVGLLFFGGSVTLFGSKFLGYQIRSAWREQPGARILVGCGGWCVALSIVVPSLLEAAWYMCIGAIVVVFEALLRAADPIEDD